MSKYELFCGLYDNASPSSSALPQGRGLETSTVDSTADHNFLFDEHLWYYFLIGMIGFDWENGLVK